MAEKDLVIKEKLEHSGIFSFSGFYHFSYNWLKYEEYNVTEEEYVEKVTGNEKMIVIKWKAFKSITDYFKIEHAFKMEFLNLTDVEVEVDGVKKNTNKGGVKVEMRSYLVKDPESKWESTSWYKFLRELYDKYLIAQRLDDMKFKVITDITDLKEQMKSYLQLSGRR